MSELKASVIVSFGETDDDRGILKAGLYEDINPPSPFALTAEISFLVFKSDNVFYNTPIPSSGTVALQGKGTVEKEQDVNVLDETTTLTFDYPPDEDSIPIFKWYGDAPVVTKVSKGVYTFSIAAGTTFPFVGKVTYKTTGDNFLLTPPTHDDDVTEYKIIALVTGGLISA